MNLRRGVIRILALSGAAALTAAAAFAQPCDVVANHATHYSSLTAALAALPGRDGNRLDVTGVCQEKVTVQSHVNLTIEGSGGARLEAPPSTTQSQPQTLNIRTSDNVTVRALTIRGKTNVSGAVSVWQSRGITFDNTTIEGGGSEGGVWIIESFGVTLQNAVIQNNSNGIRVDGPASVVLQGAWNPSQTGTAYLQNNITGARTGRGAVLSLRGDTLVRNNGSGVQGTGGGLSVCCFEDIAHPHIEDNTFYGIFMRGGDVQIQSQLVVQRNGIFGLVLIGTQARLWDCFVRDNGSPQFSGGGILASSGLVDMMRADFSDNQGPGLIVSDGGSARLSAGQISGNDGEGIDVQNLSALSVFGTTVKDNHGFDVRCAPSSSARGASETIGKLQCPGFNHSPDPVPGPKE